MNYYIDALKDYAKFDGRATRTQYWMFYLFNFVFSFVLGFVDGMLGLAGDSGYGPLGGLYSLAVLIPAIAVGVRRMHDGGRSGWWLIVPIANLVFLIMDGTHGPNQYGPDPKGQTMGYQAAVPAGWLTDPTGRHQLRYWDSMRWTDNVSDSGVTGTDPIN